MKHVVLSLVGLLMFVGCDIKLPTVGPPCGENGTVNEDGDGCSWSFSGQLDGNPFRKTLDCAEPSTIWNNGLYPEATTYSYCCCIEGATNYSEHIDFDYYSWNFNCDVSDSTDCYFEEDELL